MGGGSVGAIGSSDAVSLGRERLDVADLVLVGLIDGSWPRFERTVNRGLALERDTGTVVSGPDLKARATEFRYAHRLLSAREFTSWLAARSLSVADLSGVLRRAILRERASGGASGADVDVGVLADVLRAEALCGGILVELARVAIDRLAAAHRLGRFGRAAVDERVDATLAEAMACHAAGLPTLGEAELRARLQRLWAYEDARHELRRQVAEPDALRRRLTEHGLDWMLVEGSRLRFAAEGAAREARALLTCDGLGIEEVSTIAGAVAVADSLYLDELPQSVAGALAAVAPGEVAAPWLQDEEWNVLVVSSKRSPSAEDPMLRERAIDELLADVLRREAAGRAKVHGAF